VKDAPRWVRALPLALVLASCAASAVAYRSELLVRAPEVNDAVFHLGLMQRMSDVWDAGGNPLDPWIPYWGLGFPVLRYYQHLPHVTVVAAYHLLLKSVSLSDLCHAFLLICLTLLPASFYWGARLLGLPPLTCALAALCAPLVGTDPAQRMLLGLQGRSFSWSGPGLFTQLFALLFFAPAVGAVHRAVLTGQRWAAALALLWATWMSHLLLGYSACLLGLSALARPEARGRRRALALRLLALYAVTGVTLSHLLLPTLFESRYLGRSVWEDISYWDSFGAGSVLRMLAGGGLLDGARLPVLTLLALGGAVVAAVRRANDPQAGPSRAVLAGFALALLLFFGRATWGALTALLPFSGSLPFHRFICAVQYGGVLLAALALGALWQKLRWQDSAPRAAACVVVTLALLGPALWSTANAARENGLARSTAVADYARNGVDLDAALDRFTALDRESPGRGWAGNSWNWGREYRVAFVPIYMFWTPRDLMAISYMFHSMSLSSDLEPLFDDKRPDHYDLFNVRRLLVFKPIYLPPFAHVLSERPGVVAATVDTHGMFELVGVSSFIDAAPLTPAQLFELEKRFIQSAWHAAGQYVRVARDPGATPRPGETVLSTSETFAAAPPLSRPPGQVSREWGHDDRFGAEVDAGAPAWMLFRMTYHPGWRVRVDGQPVETAMLSPAYLGFRVEPGHHTIEAAYDPGRWTLWLFLVEQLLLVAAFAVERGLPRRGVRA
jgi:hypothetical protein